MLPLLRLVVPDVKLTESTVLHDVAIRAHRLLQDLLPMSNE